MGKFLKSMVVLLAIVALAAPAFAADNLSLGGQMRVGGWYLDDGSDATTSYIEQRLRIGGKFSVSDGVSVTFRTDFSEQNWGDNPSLGRTAWQLDRAHLDITKDIFHLRAGQLYFGTGGQYAVDTETTGAVLDMNFGAAALQLTYLLPDNNGAGADDHIIVAKLSHKTDLYSGDVFVANARNRSAASDLTTKSASLAAFEAFAGLTGRDAMTARLIDWYASNDLTDADIAYLEAELALVEDFDDLEDVVRDFRDHWSPELEAMEGFEADLDEFAVEYAEAMLDADFADTDNIGDFAGEDIYVYGANATFNLDAVKLVAGLSLFDGDYLEALDIEVMGTQFNLDASMSVSETVTAGAAFYYAAAADADEIQVTYVGNGFNGYDPTNFGPLGNDKLFSYANRVFDFTGANAGVMGGQLYATVQANDAAKFFGSIAYLTPEDDDLTAVDSDLALNVGMTYQLMDGVSTAAQLQYIDQDAPGADAKTAAGLRLYVNF